MAWTKLGSTPLHTAPPLIPPKHRHFQPLIIIGNRSNFQLGKAFQKSEFNVSSKIFHNSVMLSWAFFRICKYLGNYENLCILWFSTDVCTYLRVKVSCRYLYEFVRTMFCMYSTERESHLFQSLGRSKQAS